MTSQVRAAFEAALSFKIDDFQVRALDAIDAGLNVLVSAPTGSGKTVVAEYAIECSLSMGKKAFYTSPLKALSNQKYTELVARLGSKNVGLLTGDTQRNGDAPVVVMTTEVLRNMIYARSESIDDLAFVILDEVHYLQDRYRGPVWEEVIIHSPPEVRLVCLSATVSNATEVADWLSVVRGETEAVVEQARPVELSHLYLFGDSYQSDIRMLPTFVDGVPNPSIKKLDDSVDRSNWRQQHRRRERLYSPSRVEVIDVLESRDMLPAIFFVFSRKGCDDSVSRCMRAGIRLTSPAERAEIRALIDAHLAALSKADLRALDYGRFVSALEAGIAPHHAAMVPPFKEVVEQCFVRGLLKVVFATETLALGVNMPARTVVIDRLTKFSGSGHIPITPGEFTQLTGRAGRRGIDELGYAVVTWSPSVPFAQVANLASDRSYELTSAFRPTYNMAANLVQSHRPSEARHLLNLSFAQYQTDQEVVLTERRLGRVQAEARRFASLAECDVFTEVQLRERMSLRNPARVEDSGRLVPGDIVRLRRGKSGEVVVIATVRRRGSALYLRVMTRRGKYFRVDSSEVAGSPITRIELPTPYLPNDVAWRSEVAGILQSRRDDPVVSEVDEGAKDAPQEMGPTCDLLDEHLAALRQLDRLNRDEARLKQQVKGRSESLARQFDRVLEVLESWGYVEDWSLTDDGRVLAGLYHEADLVVAEALKQGLLDELDPAALAGMVSCMSFESRRGFSSDLWFPGPEVLGRWERLERISRALNRVELRSRLVATRELDAGFFPAAYAWANQESLDEVLHEEGLTGGDFVRVMKLVIDLLRQLVVLGGESLSRSAALALERVARGVVVLAAPGFDRISESADLEPDDQFEEAGEGDPTPRRVSITPPWVSSQP